MIKPLLHRIIVKPDKLEQVSKDVQRMKKMGLVLPDSDDKRRAETQVDRGVVVAIGATAYKDYGVSPPINVGDVVNYAKFSGKYITDPETDEEFLALNDEDLICILKETND
jgi:co-chaperonin GroES (HSP10)